MLNVQHKIADALALARQTLERNSTPAAEQGLIFLERAEQCFAADIALPSRCLQNNAANSNLEEGPHLETIKTFVVSRLIVGAPGATWRDLGNDAEGMKIFAALVFRLIRYFDDRAHLPFGNIVTAHDLKAWCYQECFDWCYEEATEMSRKLPFSGDALNKADLIEKAIPKRKGQYIEGPLLKELRQVLAAEQ